MIFFLLLNIVLNIEDSSEHKKLNMIDYNQEM